MLKPPLNYIKEHLAQSIINLHAVLARETQDSQFLAKPASQSKIRWQIKLVSRWSKEGEQDVELEEAGDPQLLLGKAERIFRERNNRSDVQADYYISAVLKGGTCIPLPIEYAAEWRE